MAKLLLVAAAFLLLSACGQTKNLSAYSEGRSLGERVIIECGGWCSSIRNIDTGQMIHVPKPVMQMFGRDQTDTVVLDPGRYIVTVLVTESFLWESRDYHLPLSPFDAHAGHVYSVKIGMFFKDGEYWIEDESTGEVVSRFSD